MSIKQTGGVFGRNPTFNDVTIEGELTFDGDVDINSDLKIDGNLEVTGTSSLTSNVAIGPSTADTLLHISGDATAIIRLENTDTSVVLDEVIGAVEFEKRDGSGAGAGVAGSVKLIAANSTGAETALTFGTSSTARGNNAEAARFTSSGNLAFPSGQGIDFSATSGTGTSELFDDYEEGTWTPAFHGSGLTITYDQQVGKYVKIGNSIFFSLFLGTDAVSGESGSVALEISGLPYAMDESNKSSGVIGLSYGFGSSIAGATWISGGYSRIDLYAQGNTAATLKTDVLGTTTNDNRLYIAGQYFAA